MDLTFFLHTPALSGIGKYVQDIINAIEVPNETYSLIFKKDAFQKEYIGHKILGSFQIPFTDGWYLNSHFQKTAFRHLRKKISKMDSPDKFYHYVDHVVKPFTPIERSVITIHDMFRIHSSYKRKYGYNGLDYMLKYIDDYKKFQHILTDSDYVKQEIINYGFEFTPTTIYPPVASYFKPLVDRSKLRAKWELPPDKLLVLSVSTNDPRKNLRTVKGTMEILDENYSLVRIGPPMEGAYNFSNLTGNEVNEIYNICDVLLFPTLDEGFGYPLAEAMAVGLPIVSSDIPVVNEVTSGAAILVQPDPANCKQGVKDAIAQREKIQEIGFKRSEIFTFDLFAKNIREYYKSLEN